MIYSLLPQQSFSLDKCRFLNGFSPWTLFLLQSSNPCSPLPPLSLPSSWLIRACCRLDEQRDPTTRSTEAPASTQLLATCAETPQSAPNLLRLTQAPACLTGMLISTPVHFVASLEPDPKSPQANRSLSVKISFDPSVLLTECSFS